MNIGAVDMVRVAHIVEDHAGQIYARPALGGSRSSTARYLAEGPLKRLCERRGWCWRELCKVVAVYLDEHPEVLKTAYTDEEIQERVDARKAAGSEFEVRASAAFHAGDFEGALELLDEGEMVAPDGCPQIPGAPFLTWESLRELVCEQRLSAESKAG